MSAENRIGGRPAGSGARLGLRGILKTTLMAACAASLAFLGCSDGGKKSVPKVVTNPDGDKKPVDPGKVISALDSLVKSTKGTGKGVVTGFLTGEGKSIAKGLLKTAANAAGERRLLVKDEIPLTGATVLIFNAEKPTTLPDATLKTDSTGTYTGVLTEGKYFGFAVYLDLETFQLVTTQIPNMNPKKDTIIRMDTAVAIEDETAPTVVGVYDASSANSDGVFLVGSVPDKNAKINITFSEPMNRESAKHVVIGKVDTSSTSLALVDTAKATISWSGDSKELTLNVAELSAGVQYVVIIPVSLKDLAKNPLEAAYKATFAPVAAAEIEAVAFAVASSTPEDKGSLKPIQNPAVSFNRPVDVFSVVKGATISPEVTGFWEVVGGRATFVHKAPFEIGKTYTITLPETVKDLGGKALAKAHTFSFIVKDFEGAAKDATGADKAIALSVETMFDAYIAGDLGRFAAAFHVNFRMYQGAKVLSKTQFLDNMKADIGQRVNLQAGMPAPVFDVDSSACKEKIQRWKVGAQGDASVYVWVESYVTPGSTPRVWDKDRKEIDRSKLTWDKTGPRFTLDGKVFGFAPDFSKFAGGVNLDASKDNMRFMADVMAKTSTIVLEPVKMEMKETFLVDGGMSVIGDTARLAVKMTNTEKMSRGNFDPNRGCGSEGLEQVRYEILKFMLVNDGARWVVLSIVAPDEEIRAEDMNKTVDVKNNFGNAAAKPISLVAPVNGKAPAGDANGAVKFEFNGVAHDSVGGYLVGIAEDPKFVGGRPPFGLLLFVKASNKTGAKETFTLDSKAKVSDGNATAVLRRVQDLQLPGWERTQFEYTLSKLYLPDSGFAGVYQWKCIAVRDTSAAQFLSNGFKMNRYFGESDFGPNRGHFAVKMFPQGAAFEQFNNQVFVQPVANAAGAPMGFGDMDQDGVPDFIENKYGSDMRDRNSFPDFRVDTDGDKLCDFLEKKLDPKGTDSLVEKAGDAAKIRSEIEALAKLTPPIMVMDSDNDGFPDDIEEMLGFNPRDPNVNPGTKARANVPVGVFSGKVQVGTATHTLSLKLSQDSAKALWVYVTAYFGKDTVIDTSRAFFNEGMGEVQMALPLPKNGPDAGRALLLRGRYESSIGLLMGPVDMIQAVAKTSTNFGSGPYVGQFAASSRGEDVSRYLPGNAGTTGPVVNNPINTQPVAIGYRMPPAGTNEGALVVFAENKLILVDDFGDTLVVFDMVNWRSQPDGSYEMFAEHRKPLNGGTWRYEAGGRVMFTGTEWVIDGRFIQNIDSIGFHKDIPGQLCAKAARDALKPRNGTPGLEGTMKGWIFQDKLGGGFVGPVNPNPTNPTCPVGQVCNNPNPTCPAGQVCNNPTTPVNSFNAPLMGSIERVIDFEKNVVGADSGLVIHVSMNGRIYVADLDDSTESMNAKFPWCGQVTTTLNLIPLDENPTEEAKRMHMEDSMMLARMPSTNVAIFIEAQGNPGRPALLDKARTANGDIVTQVYVVESRTPPPDYGKAGMTCGNVVTNPNPCPVGQTCPNPNPNPCPIGQTCPNPNPNPGGRLFLQAEVSSVQGALAMTQNKVWVMRDTAGALVEAGTLLLDPASVKFDTGMKAIVANELGKPDYKVAFLAEGDVKTPKTKDNMAVVLKMMGPPPGGQTCPAGQTCPPINQQPPVGDTSKPVVYKGTLDNLRAALSKANWMAELIQPPPALPMVAEINSSSLKQDGEVFTATEVGRDTRIYVFMGQKANQTFIMTNNQGRPIVTLKPSVAGNP